MSPDPQQHQGHLPGDDVVALGGRQGHHLPVPDLEARRALVVGDGRTRAHVELEDRQPDLELGLGRHRLLSAPLDVGLGRELGYGPGRRRDREVRALAAQVVQAGGVAGQRVPGRGQHAARAASQPELAALAAGVARRVRVDELHLQEGPRGVNDGVCV